MFPYEELLQISRSKLRKLRKRPKRGSSLIRGVLIASFVNNTIIPGFVQQLLAHENLMNPVIPVPVPPQGSILANFQNSPQKVIVQSAIDHIPVSNQPNSSNNMEDRDVNVTLSNEDGGAQPAEIRKLDDDVVVINSSNESKEPENELLSKLRDWRINDNRDTMVLKTPCSPKKFKPSKRKSRKPMPVRPSVNIETSQPMQNSVNYLSDNEDLMVVNLINTNKAKPNTKRERPPEASSSKEDNVMIEQIKNSTTAINPKRKCTSPLAVGSLGNTPMLQNKRPSMNKNDDRNAPIVTPCTSQSYPEKKRNKIDDLLLAAAQISSEEESESANLVEDAAIPLLQLYKSVIAEKKQFNILRTCYNKKRVISPLATVPGKIIPPVKVASSKKVGTSITSSAYKQELKDGQIKLYTVKKARPKIRYVHPAILCPKIILDDIVEEGINFENGSVTYGLGDTVRSPDELPSNSSEGLQQQRYEPFNWEKCEEYIAYKIKDNFTQVKVDPLDQPSTSGTNNNNNKRRSSR